MILNADARAIPLRDGSVQCVVTSPPYWGLRDYGVEGQLGLERTPEDYVAGMVAVFREVRRVLRDDGTVWLNLGDSYASGEIGRHDRLNAKWGDTPRQQMRLMTGLKPKDLVGIPWRVAFALQADGWWLRSDIVWSKPNPMPESITDRPTKAHEYVFLLAKSERYYYDAEAIKENQDAVYFRAGTTNGHKLTHMPGYKGLAGGTLKRDPTEPYGWAGDVTTYGRNRRSVWEIATQPYPEAHFATFPEALVEPCVLAGTSERGCCPTCGAGWERVVESPCAPPETYTGTRRPPDVVTVGDHAVGMGQKRQAWREQNPSRTVGWEPGCTCGEPRTTPPLVLDPFAGSGTVGQVCHRLGRRFVGLELKPDYCRMAYRRTAQLGLV